VDSFQGREKDIIIISCVRTEATGFLKCRLRLNVALTRARHSLLMIGDMQCLGKVRVVSCLTNLCRLVNNVNE
jgi:superfamily I DNA and/or RNA helicase